MIVVDASVLLECVLNTPAAARARDILFGSGATLHAPDLIDLEIVNVLTRQAAAGIIAPARGRMAVDVLADVPMRRYGHVMLLRRIWSLRHNLSAYDAVYVAPLRFWVQHSSRETRGWLLSPTGSPQWS